MAKITGGVVVTGFISPTDDTDVYATHDSWYGVGGFREVFSITQRNAISIERRRAGMLVAVTGDQVYQLIGGISDSNWQPFSIGASVTQLQIAGSCFGQPDPDAIIMRFVAATRFQFTANLPISQGRCNTFASGPTHFNLCHNGGIFGRMSFDYTTGIALDHYATFSSSNVTFFPQDELTVVADSIVDPTIADLEWTLVGNGI